MTKTSKCCGVGVRTTLRAGGECSRFRQQPSKLPALLSDFDLLRQIYGTLVIPPAVYREVVERGTSYPVAAALGEWISVAEAPDAAQIISLQREHRLDAGAKQF
jgi:predicted nucleic acid-binding protein